MKQLLMAVAVCLTMTACEKAIEVEELGQQTEVELPDGTVAKTKKFTFTMKGDFSDDWKTTRGYLAADGRDMTDVWVLDYMNGQLVQQLHQGDNTADDFGKPQMSLAYGSHHVYFVASRGTGADMNVGEHRLTWEKVSDTFYKDYAINVTGTSNGSRTVTLDRCVTKLTAVITDEIPTGAATFNITPTAWHYGIDYVSGNPTAATASQTITINIPSSEIGFTGERLNIFGFSADDEWTTDVAIDCKTSTGTILGTATITDVPLKQNRITTFSGPLFSAEGLTTVSLSTEWLDAHTGTW